MINVLVGFLGALGGTVLTYVLSRQKNLAEIAKLKAETDKTNAEAEKIRSELQPLREELRRVRNSASIPPMLSIDEYDLRIIKPIQYENVGQSFRVIGTYQTLPEGQTIWTATFDIFEDGQGRKRKRYWPQEQATIEFTSTGKEWHCVINNIGGGDEVDSREYIVLVVGVEGQALFNYFKKVGSFTHQWLPIVHLTTDVVECATGKVTYTP